MDLVPLVNDLSEFTPTWQKLAYVGAVLLVVYYLLFSQFGKRLATILHDVMFTNWRLGLLGLTGVVLSVASGWTTWDGMSNFTNEPLLSALVTFGIQGIMLIVAWLIGESFATGMNFRPRGALAGKSAPLRILQPIASSVAGILLFTALGIFIYSFFAVPDAVESARLADAPWWITWWDKLAVAAPIVVLVALLIINAGSDVLEDYMQSLRIMIRSAVLWVMFLACMATSVFFSFDSLFSTIFPAEERQRAADLRAQNQVAGIVNDIAALTATRRLGEQEALFTNPAWNTYSDTLDRLAVVAAGAEDKLRAFMEQKLLEQQNRLNRFQEDKSSAEAQQVSLTRRKGLLNTEIGRQKERVAGLLPEVTRLKGQVFEKDREVIAKKAEAEAEAGGIGVTSKVGRGPKYREIKQQLDRLNEEKRNLELQLREFEQRLTVARKKLTQSETELKQTDGELAKLKSRSDAATRMIEAHAERDTGSPRFDAANGLLQLAKAREEFRREPTSNGLARIQTLCGAIVAAMQTQPVLAAQVSGIDCDPGAASEAATRVFALNAGLLALQQNCVGGGKLPGGGADVLFAFARRCVQDAGLPSSDTTNLRKQINIIELNRDDKAHRFVVTTNAFQDGNKLAYLALAIAIAIDALVFMSGLFGANAVRSPLSDVPSHKGRSARQLADVVENALLPDKFENAMHALEAIQPVVGAPPAGFGPGWTHETSIPENEIATRHRVLKVVNAGATIGAVRRDELDRARYFIRGELVEFLNQVAKNAFERDKDKVKLADLRKIVTVALQPYVSDHADIVLEHMLPISDKNGFTSEIFVDDELLTTQRAEREHRPAEIAHYERRIVKRALNAGSTLGYVQHDDRQGENGRFYVHREFYRVLATISAEHPKSGLRHTFGNRVVAPATTGAIEGGPLPENAATPEVEPPAAQRRITHDVSSPAPSPPAEVLDNPESRAEPDAEAREAAAADDRNEFLKRLLGRLNIDPASVDFRLAATASGNNIYKATWQALQEHIRNDQVFVGGFNQARGDIQIEFERIRDELDGDAAELELLQQAKRYVDDNLGGILLMPESNFLGRVIEGYGPEQETNRNNLVDLRNALTIEQGGEAQIVTQAIRKIASAAKVVKADFRSTGS